MKDIRDLRDPILLGEKLLSGRRYPKNALSERYENIKPVLNAIDNYSGEMTGFYTAQEYLRELETRDDRYAKSTLDSICAGAKPSNAEIV